MNWQGLYALFYREVWRFLRVGVQTVAAPMITAVLYLMVFQHLLEGRVSLYEGVSYTAFLVPGIIMMSVIQNAFSNASSSIMQSKMMGNLVFVLMAPLSSLELFLAYVGSSVVRAILVAISIYLVAIFYTGNSIAHPFMLFGVILATSAMMGAFGMLAGLWADKIDQLAAFQNFVIMPFSFLSGVFYSVQSLPEFWRQLSLFNPFFYMIDAFRYAFLGVSDVAPGLSCMVIIASLMVASGLGLLLLHKGYKIRH